MRAALRNENRAARQQLVYCTIIRAQQRLAHSDIVKVGMPWPIGEAQAECRSGLNSAVLHTAQLHPSQQFADEFR